MRTIAVIGLGGFGSAVARALSGKGVEVLAIDREQKLVENIKDAVAHAATLNATEEEALRAVSIQNVDVAVVCIGKEIEANLLTTILLKKMGLTRIWTRVISPLQEEMLKMLQVEKIINLETEMGQIVALSLASANITRHIPLSKDHSMVEMNVPEAYVGKTLRSLDPRGTSKVNIVAIKQMRPAITDHGERTMEAHIEDIPDPDVPLEEEDILIVVGSDTNVESFANQ